jgi:putative cardiolipin synthase
MTSIARGSAREPRLLGAIAAAIIVLLLAGCATLPPPPPDRTPSTALTDTAGTRIGRALADDLAAHPGRTGVHAVPNPYDALAARIALADAAERSIDAQYYIWHDDLVGNLMFEALWRAAERGVRVRLLLDDMNTKGLDATLATLDAHPNIEVRLYNPLVQRDMRLLNFATEFSRLNRRMHNKSFTVDNKATVVGGRNIGDEYYGAGEGIAFSDLDVVAVGDAVGAVSKQFDLYWNSASAYPAPMFVGAAPADGTAALLAQFAATRAEPATSGYLDAVRDTPLVRDLAARQLALEWTTADLVYDDPGKTLETEEHPEALMFTHLVETMGRPETSMDLVSPYFIPGEQGTQAITAIARRGVRVRILTNSLSSAEAAVVHSGYAKRREALLAAGVELYELKAIPGAPKDREKQLGPSVGSALHAKTYAVDRKHIFVGSFNFDPRSARLNTEMGLVIHSPVLAQRLADALEKGIGADAYRVRFGSDGRTLEWIERTPTGEVVYPTEPETTFWKRFGVGFMSVLPIEWLL